MVFNRHKGIIKGSSKKVQDSDVKGQIIQSFITVSLKTHGDELRT